MILAYILSFLGMLAWQWGVRAEFGGAGKALGVIFAVVALWKTFKELGGRYADKKDLLIHLGIHAAIWVAGMLLYEYILGLITIIGFIIGCMIFTNSFGSSDSRNTSGDKAAAGDEYDISRIPTIVYDDNNQQWKRRGVFGDHAVYYNSNGDEVTIYSGQISGSGATTSAGNLHWY